MGEDGCGKAEAKGQVAGQKQAPVDALEDVRAEQCQQNPAGCQQAYGKHDKRVIAFGPTGDHGGG